MPNNFNDDEQEEWEDLRPDLGDYRLTFKETFSETVIFFLKTIGVIIAILIIVALYAYDFWREWMIFQFLVTGSA